MAWTINFPRAHWTTDQEVIDVDLESHVRWCVTEQSAMKTAGELLSEFEIIPSEARLPINVDLLGCSDAYARESDLIALFAQEYPWPFGYQVDMRIQGDLHRGVRAIELWLSVSTSMLECNPKLHVIPSNAFLSRAEDDPLSVASHGRAAWMVHPLDMADCRVVSSESAEVVGQWDIFGGFMEKGVIRRARFLMAWSDKVEPASTWDHVLDWFAQTPLPLTA